MRRFIVDTLDHACMIVDRLPSWTYWPVKRWLGCPTGLAHWGGILEHRWGMDVERRRQVFGELDD